jgi:hypothetical protein
MSKRLFARATAVLAATLLGGSVLVGISSPAQAASLGPVTLAPNTSGLVTDNPMFGSGTTNACPAGFGENANLRIGRPGGPYSNLAPALGGGGYDTHSVTINPNRSFQTAIGSAPAAGDWWVVMECYSLTEGRHVDEFETVITVTGNSWTVKTAAQTTTTLDITPAGQATTGDNVTLTAHVTPAAAGSVDFVRGTATVIGSAPTDAAGNASISTTSLPIGTHQIKAVFHSADPGSFLDSSSTAQPYVINPRGPGADQELVTITANVEQGAFTIDVASNATSLAGGSVGGAATGSLPQATVTDLRGTNVGWNVTGDLTDFANGPSIITNNNLSWTPSAAKVSGSGSVTAGSSADLGATRTLCSAASPSSAGVFHCDAGLDLSIPDNASPGEYTATLTLTLS